MAYEINGSVYFDVLKYNEKEYYGILSKRKIEDAIENTRDLEGQSDKKNSQDFALWKKAGPEHIQRWDSPWGVGFPGWHLECTVMSTKYLGEVFDIHGGGMDLKFPHHECEIAQAQACNHLNPVRYWMHGNMLTLDGKKMAKSTGNNILPNQIFDGSSDKLSKPFAPSVVRFFMMQAHYRSILDFSSDALLAAEKGFGRLAEAMVLLESLGGKSSSSIDILTWKENCSTAMNDDFNTPILIANLFDGVKYIHLLTNERESLNTEDLKVFRSTMKSFFYDVLGLKLESGNDTTNNKLSGVVSILIGLREQARANKNWALSDQIRDELLSLGIQLKDSKEGTTFLLN